MCNHTSKIISCQFTTRSFIFGDKGGMATGPLVRCSRVDRRRAYRRALVDVAKELSVEEVKTLAWECTFIDRSNQSSIQNGIHLLDVMEECEYIKETYVNNLVEILTRRELKKAASILEAYQQNYITVSESKNEGCLDLAEDNRDDSGVLYEIGNPVLHEKLCNDQVCDVVVRKDYTNDLEEKRQDLQNLLKTSKDKCKIAKDLCHHQREFHENTRKQVEGMIQDACSKTHQSIDYKENDLMIKLEKAGQTYNNEAQDLEEKFMTYHNIVTKLENNICDVSSDQFIRWRQLKDVKEQTLELLTELEDGVNELRKRDSAILYHKVPNNSTFYEIKMCSAINGLMINENQMVQVIDQRVINGNVLLVCFDITESTKEYWRYQIKPINCINPLLISHTHMWYNDRRLILFAIGKTIFIVKSYHVCPIYEYVEKVSTLEIDDVSEGSWITSIAAHNPNNNPYDTFVITKHSSQAVFEYNISGILIRTIDVGDLVHSTEITCLAYYYNTFSVICRDQNDVKLVTSGDKLHVRGLLKSPSTDLLPIIVICMGGKWWVLFVTNGIQRDWKVVNYDEDGALVITCEQGRAYGGMDLPISLDIWQRDGFVAFPNSTLRNFAIT